MVSATTAAARCTPTFVARAVLAGQASAAQRVLNNWTLVQAKMTRIIPGVSKLSPLRSASSPRASTHASICLSSA
eukprot:112825-Pleurochrysis_carterae.AAC.1